MFQQTCQVTAVSADILVGQEDSHGEKVDSLAGTDGDTLCRSQLGVGAFHRRK